MAIELKMILLILCLILAYFGIWEFFSALGFYFSNMKRWKNSDQRVFATVYGFLDDGEEKSKNLVEKKVNGHFQAFSETVDKSVHYMRVPNFKKRSRLILEWKNGVDCYRAYHPYAQKKWSFNTGDTMELHYNSNKPWVYAINNSDITRDLIRKSSVGILCMLIVGSILCFLF